MFRISAADRRYIGAACLMLAVTAAGLLAVASSLPGRQAAEVPAVDSSIPPPHTPPSPTYQFPAGGRTLAGEYRLVALYGAIDTPVLGVLGEQPIEASIKRVKALADEYQAHSKEKIMPAFEIIATVAAAEPTSDGDYSREAEVSTLKPWIDAARRAGVYVVLDLQPGRDNFLYQAQQYELLLREPHVGLALDSEWRLGPNERHLEQIGSVTHTEVNAVSKWLAGLVRTHNLPQKLLLLHQFRSSMLVEREKIALRPELHTVVQMDGQGAPHVKHDSWAATIIGGPEGLSFGWKNFHDEDEPMLGVKETMSITPQPWFVSYQ